MRARILLPLLAAIALLPGALAGSADDPEVRDPERDGRVPAPCQDLTTAWIETNATGGLTAHLTVASCPAPPPTGQEWWGFVLRDADGRYYAHAVYDPSVGYVFWSGKLRGEEGLEPEGHHRAVYAYEGGTPARLSIPYPVGIATLAPNETAEFEIVQSGVVQGWNQDLPTIWDEAEGRAYTRERAPSPPLEPPAEPADAEPTPEPEAPPPVREAPAASFASWIALALGARVGFIKSRFIPLA